MTPSDTTRTIELRDLELCFEGAVPAVIATASADGTPNITYLSVVRMVDGEHVALSNQFFSKTSRNLAENPKASVLLIDPVTYSEYRLMLTYERTERRGPVFERLRDDVETVANMQGMEGVFKLRAADIYRVSDIELVPARVHTDPSLAPPPVRKRTAPSAGELATLSTRLSRCPDLDTLVSATVDGVAELLGHEHCHLMLLDENGQRLYTIASHGYDAEGIGSEVLVGEGTIGMAAARGKPLRVGNLRHMTRYSHRVRRSYEGSGDIEPSYEIPVPTLADPGSRLAVPAMALGQVVGVLVVESDEPVAFSEDDEAVLTVVASIVANAIEVDRGAERTEGADAAVPPSAAPSVDERAPATQVRFFTSDGSVFLDGEYLIKGVAGRILWSLLGHHERDGRVEFTNREVRLDPTLELPEFRDNLESRLILLKRRLDERHAPVRIEKTGRGRFRLVIEGQLRLEAVQPTS